MKLSKPLSTLGGILLAVTAAVGVLSAASAATAPGTDTAAVAQVRSALPASERAKFDNLSAAQQEEFVGLLSDPDAYEVRVTEEPALATPHIASRMFAAAATTRTYSKVSKLDYYMFGITIGTYRQEIRYNVVGTKDNGIQMHKRQQQVGTSTGSISHAVWNL